MSPISQSFTRSCCDKRQHLRLNLMGLECRWCAQGRGERHEASCRWLRWLWHTLIGEHVRLYDWDVQESEYMVEVGQRRIGMLEARLADGSDSTTSKRSTEEKE